MADGQVKVDVVVRSVSELKRVQRELGDTVGRVKLLDTGVGSLGNKLGFVAFQFTFMAGVAGRALGEISNAMKSMVVDNAKELDKLGRALVMSGVDIMNVTEETMQATKIISDGIRTWGSGKTIFSVGQLSDGLLEVGKAANFSGTEVEIAKKNLIAFDKVVTLATIEEQDLGTAANQFIKVMKQWKVPLQDSGKILDGLVIASQATTINISDLVQSLGAAGGQAREFGISFEDTISILSLAGDQLGVKSGGVGRALNSLITDFTDLDRLTNPTLRKLGINITDASGKFRGIVPIIEDYNKAVDKFAGGNDIAATAIRKMMVDNARGGRIIDALSQNFDQLKEIIAEVEAGSGKSTKLRELIENLPGNRIVMLQNALKSLQQDLVIGLSPALKEMVDALREIITDTGAQEFFVMLGQSIGETLVPVVRTVVRFFRAFTNTLKNNAGLIKLVTGSLITLTGVLVTLFIVGTIGALIAVMASSLQRLAAMIGLTNAAMIPMMGWFLRIAAVGLLVFMVLKAVDNIIGILKDGVTLAEAPILALNVALAALGAAALLNFGKVSTAIGGFVTTLVSGNLGSVIGTGLKNLFMGTSTFITDGMGTSFTQASPGIIGKFAGLLRGLGSAGPIGAAIAAAIAIGTAIALWIDASVKESEFFKTGLAPYWDVAGFKLKAAVANTIAAIYVFFRDLGDGIRGIFESIGKWVTDGLIHIGLILNTLKTDPLKALQMAGEGLFSVWKNLAGFGLVDTFAQSLDPLNLALDELEKRAEMLQKGGFSPEKALPSLMEVIKDVQPALDAYGLAITPEDVAAIIQSKFGTAMDPSVLIAAFQATADSLTMNNDAVLTLTDGQNLLKTKYDEVLANNAGLLDAETLKRTTEELGNPLLETLNGTVSNLTGTEVTKIGKETDQIKLLDAINSVYTTGFIPQLLNLILEMYQTSLAHDDVQRALDLLVTAINNLTSKINKTQVKFQKNDAGKVTGFNLVGGISKSDAKDLATNVFAAGGIVRGATLGLLGEAGPEAVIPLDRLNELTGGQGITNNITVNVEGIADDLTADDIAERVIEKINESIRNKSIRTR